VPRKSTCQSRNHPDRFSVLSVTGPARTAESSVLRAVASVNCAVRNSPRHIRWCIGPVEMTDEVDVPIDPASEHGDAAHIQRGLPLNCSMTTSPGAGGGGNAFPVLVDD